MLNRNPEDFLVGKLEDNENFKATPEFKTWLALFANQFDITRSDFIREAICFYATLVSACPELRNISIQRLRGDKEFVRNILVLLNKV